MRKLKTKFISALIAFCCVFACLGVGTVLISNKATEAKAATYTEHNIGALELHVNSQPWGGAGKVSNQLYLQRADGGALPIQTWDYFFAKDSDVNFKINGKVAAFSEMKSTDAGLFFLFNALNAGEYITISGTFTCEAANAKYIIAESTFLWDSTGWSKCEVYDIGALELHVNSKPWGGAGKVSNQLYLQRADGGDLPIQTWDYLFTKCNDVSFKINGEAATFAEMKSTDAGLFFLFGRELSAGECITISGTFICKDLAKAYVIEETSFIWTGTEWQLVVQYDTYTVTKLASAAASTAEIVEIYSAGGDAISKDKANWTDVYTFLAGSGAGFSINDTAFTPSEIKMPNDVRIVLGVTVNTGNVLTIDGTIYNENTLVQIVFKNCKLQWNGTAWVEYVHIEYTTNETSGLTFAQTGEGNKHVYFVDATGHDFPVATTENDLNWTTAFSWKDGKGVTLNGNAVSATVKFPGQMFIDLGAAPTEGDVLVVGGTFYNADLAYEYIIGESTFTWNGTTWVEYVPPVEYTVHNIGALDFHSNVNAGGNGIIYLKRADNKALPVLDWHAPFLAESAENFKINGVAHEVAEIQSTSDGFYWKLGKTLNAGDYITISGTFVCETKHVKYVITESKFVWNGSAWEKYVDYTVYNTGSVYISGVSANSVDVAMVGGKYEITDGTWAEKLTFLAGSGVGVTINGNQVGMNDIKIPNDIYIGSLPAAKVGDILAIEGTFYNVNLAVKYVIEYHEFIYNGVTWVYYVDEELLAAYDLVTPINLGLPASLAINGVYDGAGLSYEASSANTTGSVKFRFGYRTTDIATEDIGIRLRGSHWDGVHFLITWSKIGLTGNINYDLASNTDYVIELAAIDFADGSGTWIYVSVNGSLVYSAKHEVSTFNTSHLSFYAANSNSVISDVTRVTVSYETENGTVTEYVEKDAMYTLPEGKTANTFAGWLVNGEFYFAGEEIEIGNESLVLTPVELDFTMDEGAAIRITNTADNSGIRFTSRINVTALESLEEYGATVTYGTLIMPYDYLEGKYEPNMEKFVAGTTVGAQVLKIPSENHEIKDGYVVFRGAMVEINSGNYDRLFAGRGYIEITIGERKVVLYTPFSYEDNVRSIRYVAQQFKDDLVAEFNYAGLSNEKKAIVDAYAQTGTIKLLNYEAYAMDFLNVTAWYHPELDPSNAYNNITNEEIAQEMKDAGIKTVVLDGQYHIDMTTPENITKTRQMINFFGSQGLKTIVFGSNSSDGFNIKWNEKGYPDFSDCKGFIGFLVWDEPKSESFDELAVLAQEFEKTYAGTGVTYMVNLLPSYASIFNTGSTGWFDATIDQLKKGDYQAYLKSYCDTVLSQVSGEKWLSMDSYPINADKTLSSYFLFDLAMLKYYAEYAGATSHAVLQSSGWIEDGYEGKNRMPTQAEMEMQAYAAMAFGIDSISWWSYSDKREDNQQNPTDVADDGTRPYMQRFAAVNAELNAISAVYSAFDWKGVILGAGKDNGGWFDTDDDYEAFKVVKGQIGDYELTESDTKHLASVSRSNTNWNYLMGVMEDMSGNEGYVLCNYNNHKDCGEQTITITFSSNITEVVIYRDGVKSAPIAVNNKTLDVKLAIGEGVIILPSKLG